MCVLKAVKVSFKYKKSEAFVMENLSFMFNKGKITAISGPSGCGKSTMLMLLAGLDFSYSGEILFNGKNIKSLDANTYRACNIGVVFQSYNLLFQATAIDNVRMALYLSKSQNTNAKAETLLSKVGITPDKQRRKCVYLSGGEQQRVAIARALAGNPDVIIADEPTGNLDAKNAEIIMDILSDLSKKEGKCIVISTHSPSIAALTDETLIL